MSPLAFTSLIFLLQHVFSLLSLPINTFLIILIITKSPPQLGAYKYLMIFISLFEISQSLLEVAIEPLIMTSGSSFVTVIPTEDSIFSKDVLRILNVVHWGYYGSSLAVFTVHFVYRYAAMNKKSLVSRSKIIIWFLPTLFIFCICFVVAFFAARPRDEFTEYIRDNVHSNFGLLPSEFSYMGMYIYGISPKDGSIFINYRDCFCSLVFGTAIFSSFAVMIYFGWKCYHCLSVLINCSTTSKTYSKLQSQLFYSLVIQTSIPITFLIFPGTICVFLTVFNSKSTFMNGIMSISIAFYPVIDPLPTIFIVKSYRIAVFDLLRLGKIFKNRIYTTQTSLTNKEPTVTQFRNN